MNEPVKVLITLPIPDDLVAQLREISERLDIRVMSSSEAGGIPSDIWKEIEVLYTNRALPEPEQAPSLRWIQFHWAGVNHAIQAPILAKPGLTATTLSGAGATKMAEYIMGMLFALGLRIPDLLENQANCSWPEDRWKRFQPRELRESTVGIVGYGSIGRQVARALQPFGAQVLATKKNLMDPVDWGYTVDGFGDREGDYVHRLYPAEALNSMLRECDFVVVSLPLTDSTRDLFAEEQFNALKPGAYLVDISRGGVIDHKALAAAVSEGRLSGAVLDVFPEEPLAEDSPLWDIPNVIITPHISGATAFYDERAVKLFSENLRLYLNGAPLLNALDLDEGY